MNEMNNKTNAILRLYNLELIWCEDIERKDGRMEELLKQIASDIIEGYVTFDAFTEIIIDAAGRINLNDKELATGEDIDKYVKVVKAELLSKYSERTFYPDYS